MKKRKHKRPFSMVGLGIQLLSIVIVELTTLQGKLIMKAGKRNG